MSLKYKVRCSVVCFWRQVNLPKAAGREIIRQKKQPVRYQTLVGHRTPTCIQHCHFAFAIAYRKSKTTPVKNYIHAGCSTHYIVHKLCQDQSLIIVSFWFLIDLIWSLLNFIGAANLASSPLGVNRFQTAVFILFASGALYITNIIYYRSTAEYSTVLEDTSDVQRIRSKNNETQQ